MQTAMYTYVVTSTCCPVAMAVGPGFTLFLAPSRPPTPCIHYLVATAHLFLVQDTLVVPVYLVVALLHARLL